MDNKQPQMVHQPNDLMQYAELLIPDSVRALVENEANMQVIFHTDTESDGKIKITFAIQESDSSDPIYTEADLQQAKLDNKFIPNSLADWEMKRVVRNACNNGILNPRNRLLLYSTFILDPVKNELIFSIFDAAKKKSGIGTEFIGYKIGDFARQLGVKFVTASVNPRNVTFFRKVGWNTLDQFVPEVVAHLFPGQEFNPDFIYENAVLFVDDKLKSDILSK